MKQLVETAEKYLTGDQQQQDDAGANDTDREESMLSDGSGQYGQLKHSDSLLLLIQVSVVSKQQCTFKNMKKKLIHR